MEAEPARPDVRQRVLDGVVADQVDELEAVTMELAEEVLAPTQRLHVRDLVAEDLATIDGRLGVSASGANQGAGRQNGNAEDLPLATNAGQTVQKTCQKGASRASTTEDHKGHGTLPRSGELVSSDLPERPKDHS